MFSSKKELLLSAVILGAILMTRMVVPIKGDLCSAELQQTCSSCFGFTIDRSSYNCSLPGLQYFEPGEYEGVKVNYLSFVTATSSPNFPLRASEFEACTGGKIVFSEAQNVWEDPVFDLGTKTSRGSEVFDGYFMSYSHFPEVSALGLAEHLNDRIRENNDRLKWEDVLPKVKLQGEYRKDGVTNIDFLMYDGDFFVPLIRLDLLEQHDLPLPNTWSEVVEYAKYFNGTDLNDDGDADDFGFCHFPRLGAGYWDWWWPEALYSTWATYDQTKGTNQGFFFDQDTMEPRFGAGFREAAEIWKELWTHGSDGCISQNFITGRCAIGFAPPGCWKGVLLNGISRSDENGNVIWRPTMKSGEYAEPYRFKPFGSLNVVDETTGELAPCTSSMCPKAEPIPRRGHWGDDDRASILKPSPHQGSLINRVPFYWSGGLGTLIRKSSPEVKKDMMWDFFVYTNSPDTSVYDVANYASWLDSWRYSQLEPGDNFIQGGWSQHGYQEHNAVMQWALSSEVNGAFNLRLPGLAKYTRDVVGERMSTYIEGEVNLDDLIEGVRTGWSKIIDEEGKLDQLEIYRSSLGLDSHSEVDLCRLHRDLMDERDPSLCREYDPQSNYFYIGTGLRATGLAMSCTIILFSIGLMLWTILDGKNHIVVISQPIFLHIICIGTILMGASLIPMSLDGEVVSDKGGDLACLSIPWLLSMGWCFSFSALFSKTKRVNDIFHNPNMFKRIKVEAKDVIKPMVVLLLSNVIILTTWTIMSPPEWDRAPIIWGDGFRMVDDSRGGCVSNDFWHFTIPLIVINLGALAYALQQAWVARKISTEFSESEWIALAMSFILLVTFVGVPVMVIASENRQASYFVRCCLVFVLCMSLLCFIFIPKILLRRATPRDAIKNSIVRLSGISGGSSVEKAMRDDSEIEGMEILEHPKLNTNDALEALKADNERLKARLAKYERRSTTGNPTNEIFFLDIGTADIVSKCSSDSSE